MNSRERLRAVLAGQIPDRIPVCPDISNMVPARLTGKPFWDIYVHQDPPLWKAYIDAVKYFGIDGGFEVYDFGNLFDDMYPKWESRIVHSRQDGSFVTQDYCQETEQWSQTVVVHTSDNPPATDVLPSKIGLPAIPSTWEQIEGVKQWPKGFELWEMIKKELGDHGIVGMPSGARTCLVYSTDEVCEYYDNPAKFHQRREEMLELIERRMEIISNLKEKPDFLFCGDSGSLIFQTPQMFRELALPGNGFEHPSPLHDAQHAIRYVRTNAGKYGLDPERIGIMGFSAGGHLASTAGTHFDYGDRTASNKIDRASSRPDFMILVYPVITFEEPYAHMGSRQNLLGDRQNDDAMVEHLSSNLQVTSDTPPNILIHAKDDYGVKVENSVLFNKACLDADVPSELKLYEKGGHGFDLGRKGTDSMQWPKDCEQWLRSRGLTAF
jgi:dienelactone hydrolase